MSVRLVLSKVQGESKQYFMTSAVLIDTIYIWTSPPHIGRGNVSSKCRSLEGYQDAQVHAGDNITSEVDTFHRFMLSAF